MEKEERRRRKGRGKRGEEERNRYPRSAKKIGRGKRRREEEEIREKIIEVGKGREGEEEMEVGKIKREERGMYEGLELAKREKKERVGEREKGR